VICAYCGTVRLLKAAALRIESELTEPSPGLSAADAARRLVQYGRNRVSTDREETFWDEFLESLREPLVLLLVAVGVRYFLFGELREALLVLVVLFAVCIAEAGIEWRAGRVVAALEAVAAPILEIRSFDKNREINARKKYMRVVIDTRKVTSADSGIGSYTFNLVRALLEEDKELHLLLLCNQTRGLPDFHHPRVEHLHIPGHPITPNARYTLASRLYRHTFDIFHAPFEVVPRGLKQPLVVTIHDLAWIINPHFCIANPLWARVKAVFYRSNMIAALSEAGRILAVSRATKRAITEYAPWYAHKIHVTYNGFDPGRLYPIPRDEAYARLASIVPSGAPFVLTVGQGAPYKNHLNAVRGFIEAFGNRTDVHMVLVRRTHPQDAAINNLISQSKAQIHVLPYVPPETLRALFSAAHILLHPSYYEGFGIPLVEAMSMRTPIVTSNISAMPEVVGPAALLIDPAKPKAIAKALLQLDCDVYLRQQLIAEGLKRVQRFHWRISAQKTLQAYRELV